MIVDTFMFFNELDLLDIRLEYLDPVVDKFVLVEATFTQLGKPKELFFEKNRLRYKKYWPKIHHLIVDNPVTYEYGSWGNENYQRNQIACAVEDLTPEDIVILSDLDEIPSIESIEWYKKFGKIPMVCVQDIYYYYTNYKASYTWNGSQFSRGVLKDPQKLRNERDYIPRIPVFGGWHFSYLGGVDAVYTKITSVCESPAHEAYKDINILSQAIASKTLHFNGAKLTKVDVPLAVLNKYSHLIG